MTTARPELPAKLRQRMRVDGVLGQGGMGIVLRAFDTELKRNVAIKLILGGGADSVSVLRFAREGRGLAQLNHPNIVRLLDGGVSDGVHYLVMELLEGYGLDRCTARGALPPAETRDVLVGLLRGLSHVHAAGLLHRDLKPTNVFLRDGREPVLIDFGLLRPERDITPLTLPGALVGTPAYLSPELLETGRASVGSDLFALGCIGYQLLVGENLHQDVIAEGPGGVIAALLSRNYHRVAVGGLAPFGGLGDAVLRALAPDSEQRYPTAQAMLEQVETASIVVPEERPASHGARTLPIPLPPAPATPADPVPRRSVTARSGPALQPPGDTVRPSPGSRGTPVPSARSVMGVVAAVLTSLTVVLVLFVRPPRPADPRPSPADTAPASRPLSPSPGIPPEDPVAVAEAAVRELRVESTRWRDAWDAHYAELHSKSPVIGFRGDQMRAFFEARGHADPGGLARIRAVARRTLQRTVTAALAVFPKRTDLLAEHSAALAVCEAMTWADAFGTHSLADLEHVVVRLRGRDSPGYGDAVVAAHVADLRHESLDALAHLKSALDVLEARLPPGQLTQRDLLGLWFDVAARTARLARSYRVKDAERAAVGRRLQNRIPAAIADPALAARAKELAVTMGARPAIRSVTAPLLESLHGLLRSPKPAASPQH